MWHPMARIHHDGTGDNDLMLYFQTYNTFSGAEVDIQPISAAFTMGPDHDDWVWYEYMRVTREPEAPITEREDSW